MQDPLKYLKSHQVCNRSNKMEVYEVRPYHEDRVALVYVLWFLEQVSPQDLCFIFQL